MTLSRSDISWGYRAIARSLPIIQETRSKLLSFNSAHDYRQMLLRLKEPNFPSLKDISLLSSSESNGSGMFYRCKPTDTPNFLFRPKTSFSHSEIMMLFLNQNGGVIGIMHPIPERKSSVSAISLENAECITHIREEPHENIQENLIVTRTNLSSSKLRWLSKLSLFRGGPLKCPLLLVHTNPLIGFYVEKKFSGLYLHSPSLLQNIPLKSFKTLNSKNGFLISSCFEWNSMNHLMKDLSNACPVGGGLEESNQTIRYSPSKKNSSDSLFKGNEWVPMLASDEGLQVLFENPVTQEISDSSYLD